MIVTLTVSGDSGKLTLIGIVHMYIFHYYYYDINKAFLLGLRLCVKKCLPTYVFCQSSINRNRYAPFLLVISLSYYGFCRICSWWRTLYAGSVKVKQKSLTQAWKFLATKAVNIMEWMFIAVDWNKQISAWVIKEYVEKCKLHMNINPS